MAVPYGGSNIPVALASQSSKIVEEGEKIKLVTTTIHEEVLTDELLYRKLIDLENRKKNLTAEIAKVEEDIAKYKGIVVSKNKQVATTV